jgi:dTDP-4-amino-4,6-dideoxygalactose transaminase
MSIYFSNPGLQYNRKKSLINKAISRVLKSGNYILGEEVENFEKEFSRYVEKEYCVGVGSGTDAIILALRSLGIGSGDEVITPSHTAVATIAAIVATGAVPVYVDIDRDTYTVDAEKIDKLITTRTKAILAVHLYGHPCNMDLLLRIKIERNLFLVEDCAQAHGAKWKGKKVGSFGDLSCFSFYPTKNLGGIGDGGAILTNDLQTFETIKMLRQYGWNEDKVSIIQSNVSRLDEIQAAILRVKLKYLDNDNRKRVEIAKLYSLFLQDANLRLPTIHKNAEHVFHLFVVRVKNRELLLEKFREENIFPGIHYALPVHRNPSYEKYTDKNNRLIVTDALVHEIISLPIYPELKKRQVKKICKILIKFSEEEISSYE